MRIINERAEKDIDEIHALLKEFNLSEREPPADEIITRKDGIFYKEKRNMIADLITISRILFSFIMLIFPVFSPGFYVCYLAAGITDMVDGTVARRLGTVSDSGARLDTVADFIFVAVCAIRLFPILDIEKWMYICAGIIVLIKIINVISGFAVQKRFVTVHSVMNKITGGLLFALPLTIKFIDLRYSAAVVCAVAAFAAVQEGHYIRTKRETEGE